MPEADVVVPVYGNLKLTRDCLESVLSESGPSLGRVFIVDDCSPEPEMAGYIRSLRRSDARVRLLATGVNSGFVVAANLGLAAAGRDTVVLNSDARVSAGWLHELTRALASTPRLAALSPLSNNAGLCTIGGLPPQASFEDLVAVAPLLSGLDAWTELPTSHGFCLLLRRSVLELIGYFDRAYGRGYNEENDWCQRARAAGYVVGRCNRSFVFHHGEASFQGQRSRLDAINARRLLARYPDYLRDVRAFEARPGARVSLPPPRPG